MRDLPKKTTALLLTAMALLVPLVIMQPADAEPETAFEGIVTDYVTGEPLEEAYVMVMNGHKGKRALTDENGYYKIELDKGGTYSLIAEKENYHDEYTEEIIIFGETNTVDFELKPYRNYVTGRVTDTRTGEGIGEAYVEFGASGEEDVYGHTDEDGYYKIGIDAGTYEIRVRAKNYEVYREEGIVITDDGENVKDVQLKLLQQGIYGEVHDEDGNVIEEAQVHINGMGGTTIVHTDENGYYEVRLWEGSYKVNINKGGYTTTSGTVDVPKDEMVEKDWTLYDESAKSFIMRLIEWIWSMIGMEL